MDFILSFVIHPDDAGKLFDLSTPKFLQFQNAKGSFIGSCDE